MVCLYVCMYVCIHVQAHVHVCMCMYMYIHICTHVHMYMCIYIYICICMHMCIRISVIVPLTLTKKTLAAPNPILSTGEQPRRFVARLQHAIACELEGSFWVMGFRV